MTNYTKWTIALVGLMVAVTGIVIWLIQDRLFETDNLTIQEASAKIEDLYGGSVSSFEETNNIYHIALMRNNQNYDFQIDPETQEGCGTKLGSINSSEDKTRNPFLAECTK